MSTNLTSNPSWQKLEALRADIEKMCLSAGEARCSAVPQDGSWSVKQVVDHILKSEAGTLQYIQKKSSFPDTLPSTTPSAFLRAFLLQAALRSPFRFQAPHPVKAADVQELPSMEHLLTQWREIRRSWQIFLENYPEEFLSKLVFRHPLAGRLTIFQTLRFMADHLKRHQKQIQRLLHSP
ncbi:MAG: DinB family protein [Flavobacteriales bacterium]|nr:DinB family protein [Flavobacteriales bacterium]MDW8432062.1 DinB family protein [Flavobacteriales bacterium]